MIVHIGMQKTGSSFLQTRLFPNVKGLHFAKGHHTFRRLLEAQPLDKIVLTDEFLSGDPYKPHYFQQFEHNVAVLKTTWGDPKVMIGFRAHHKLILSLYKQYLHQGGTATFENFFNKDNTGLFKQEDLYVMPRLNLVKESFSQVFMFTMEDLFDDFDAFLKKLGAFAEVEMPIVETLDMTPDNVGVRSIRQVNILRRLNIINATCNKWLIFPDMYGKVFKKLRITPRHFCQNYLSGKGKPFKMEEELSQFIISKYEEDWNAVQAAVHA